MKSIKEKSISELEIQKSKFITVLYPIHNIEEVKEALLEAKKEFPNATHYCYAYILDQNERCSDDGEPSKTAGMPMLNVLKMQDYQHILAIVVRYFGGIKLGAGGLVRAYTKAMTTALENIIPVSLIPGNRYEISFSYEQLKDIDHLLKNVIIKEKNFGEAIRYQIDLPIESSESILQSLKPKTIKIEKKDSIFISDVL
ncbi:MAG TPA: YigZ family protein [Candidatus Fimihabitans intestinipullorum]|uniref:YigZ family protein n=1 Tax=Candidatus Fimihabitans intestinipullorum TaxID=2840820 RepID=A0A9D1HV20_9BACT|nr:YigZ family protein [Candidatus Fimihabitans intestinipullorum]